MATTHYRNTKFPAPKEYKDYLKAAGLKVCRVYYNSLIEETPEEEEEVEEEVEEVEYTAKPKRTWQMHKYGNYFIHERVSDIHNCACGGKYIKYDPTIDKCPRCRHKKNHLTRP